MYAEGKIPYQRYRAWELSGRTVGIVGLGAVGRAAKWRFEGVGMRVLSFDPYNPDATHNDDLDGMLAECDVVSVHAVVTPETESIMGAAQFAAMKPGAIYLNSARAMLHDTDALVAALQSGHLGGAGLDHFKGENLPTDHPLCAMNNVVLTPHIGGATYDTEANHSKLIADDVARILAGDKPVNCVNPEVLRDGRRQRHRRRDQGRVALGRAGEPAHEPRARHRRQLLGAAARRQRRAHAVVARRTRR